MKKEKKTNLILLIILIFVVHTQYLYSQTPRYIDSKDLSIRINTKIIKTLNTQHIELTWEKNELAVNYEVRKKLLSEENFPNKALIVLNSDNTTFVDTSTCIPSLIYEYELRANSQGNIITKMNNAQGQSIDSTITIDFIAFGYVTTGYEIETNEFENVLLVIDSTITMPLKDEIDRLKVDLVTEGFNVFTLISPRAEKFDKEKVVSVKTSILEINNKNKINYIFLLGRVPVPYSGNIYPDGHQEHKGAWPADLYYGSFTNHSIWTDNSVNITSASREENKNIVGDGKFDQSVLYSQFGDKYQVDAGVGRVDFYDMPVFTKSEIELLKSYLDKNHNYRTGTIQFQKKGLIDDNFSARTYIEAFASTGWRNFASLLGYENIEKADYFSKLSTDAYLWAYGTGGGTYSSAGGIGTSQDFAIKPIQNVFSILFGSYFGDWDSQNNFMRSALANAGNVLTCTWSARPHWFYQSMGIGKPIGYSTLTTINNYLTYLPNYYNINGGTVYTAGIMGTHIALLGDPTLSMREIDSIPKIKNLTITQKSYKNILLQWEEPESSVTQYYEVYRSNDYFGPYISITPWENKTSHIYPNKGEFQDTINTGSKVYYMVRKLEEKTNNSAKYKNYSRGVISEIDLKDLTSIENTNDILNKIDFTISPNPVTDFAHISIKSENFGYLDNYKINITSVTGNIIKTINLGQSVNHNTVFDIDIKSENLSAGVYLMSLITNHRTITQKFVIIK